LVEVGWEFSREQGAKLGAEGYLEDRRGVLAHDVPDHSFGVEQGAIRLVKAVEVSIHSGNCLAIAGSSRIHGKSEPRSRRAGPNAARSAEATGRRSSYGHGPAAEAYMPM
jgi:hypothetical protein